jgi:N-acetylglucosamine kinase-like BadF-type ATPase
MAYFVGIDGGGTQTHALLTDETGAHLAEADGPSGRVSALDPAANAPPLAELTIRVLQLVEADRATAMCCALSGAGRVKERATLEGAIREYRIADTIIVVPDYEAAMQDAFGDGPGILLIAGTGSSAWGRNESGEVKRCGGWGYLLGDEGSAYAIGLAGLRAALHAYDGRAGETTLMSTLLQLALVDQPEDLIGWSGAASRADVAALAPSVIRAAEDDATAAGIVEEQVRELAEHVAALHAGLGPWSGTTPIAFSGGLITPDRPLRIYLENALVEWQLDIALLERDVDAARGAAAIARAAVGG